MEVALQISVLKQTAEPFSYSAAYRQCMGGDGKAVAGEPGESAEAGFTSMGRSGTRLREGELRRLVVPDLEAGRNRGHC